MATSRKRTHELEKLKSDAAEIWGESREVLSHAGKFWHAAGSEAADIAINDVAPRVRTAIDEQVKPAVVTGTANASVAATHAKDRIVNDYAPAVAAAVKSSPLADLADDPRVADLVKQGKKAGKKLSKKAKRKAAKAALKQARKHPKAAVKVAKTAVKNRDLIKKATGKKSGIGAGGKFLIVLGIIGLGAAVFAAFQTLRADDELWVADEDESATTK